MSFACAFRADRLPEKPWRTGAVARFGISIVIGILMGAMAASVIRYFEFPQTSRMALFLTLASAAFCSYIAAIVLLARAWPAEPEITRLIILLVLIYLGFFFTWTASRLVKGDPELKNPVIAMCIAVLAFQGVALIIVPFFLRQHSVGWRDGFGLNLHPIQSLMIGVGVGILVLYPILELNQLCFDLFDKLTLHPQEQQTVDILRHADTLLGRAASAIATVLIAPVGEEIIFRGMLYPWAKRLFSQQIALWGTAFLFGAIHANLSSFLPLTILALILVWLYEYTGNLLAPIAVHVVFNGANFVALFLQQTQTPVQP